MLMLYIYLTFFPFREALFSLVGGIITWILERIRRLVKRWLKAHDQSGVFKDGKGKEDLEKGEKKIAETDLGNGELLAHFELLLNSTEKYGKKIVMNKLKEMIEKENNDCPMLDA